MQQHESITEMNPKHSTSCTSATGEEMWEWTCGRCYLHCLMHYWKVFKYCGDITWNTVENRTQATTKPREVQLCCKVSVLFYFLLSIQQHFPQLNYLSLSINLRINECVSIESSFFSFSDLISTQNFECLAFFLLPFFFLCSCGNLFP